MDGIKRFGLHLDNLITTPSSSLEKKMFTLLFVKDEIKDLEKNPLCGINLWFTARHTPWVNFELELIKNTYLNLCNQGIIQELTWKNFIYFSQSQYSIYQPLSGWSGTSGE